MVGGLAGLESAVHQVAIFCGYTADGAGARAHDDAFRRHAFLASVNTAQQGSVGDSGGRENAVALGHVAERVDPLQILDPPASCPRDFIVDGCNLHIQNGDGTMSGSAQSHLVTAAQAQAVFQQLTTRNRLPASQLSILALGDNHPLAAVATPEGRAKNRRIEIVVYPDAMD